MLVRGLSFVVQLAVRLGREDRRVRGALRRPVEPFDLVS